MLTLAIALIGETASAQVRQAGSGLDVPPDREKQLEQAVEDSPWNLGAVRLAPWAGLRDLSLVSELDPNGEQVEDLTATVGAGLRAYLPLGSNGVIAAHALPEYTWYRDQDERSTAVGRYGLGWFGFFNRLQTEVSGRRTQDFQFLAADNLVREPFTTDHFAVTAQLRIAASIALFAEGFADSIRVEPTSDLTTVDSAALLDHDSTDWRVGARYLLRGDRGYVGAGVTASRTEFVSPGADATRSNESSGSWYVGALVRGNHLDVALDYANENLEATDDSSFPGYSDGSGSLLVNFRPGWRTSFQAYAHRQLQYSGRNLATFLAEDRAGLGMNVTLGTGGLQLFYEQGENDYFGSTDVDETVTAYGGYLYFTLLSNMDLRLGGRQTTFSPDVGPDREVREVTAAIGLRVGTHAIGKPGDDW